MEFHKKTERTRTPRPESSRLTVLAIVIYQTVLAVFLFSFLESKNPLSLSMVADRFVDAISITLIPVINWFTQKPSSGQFSYGYHRAETFMNFSATILFVFLSIISAISSSYIFFTHVDVPSLSTFNASVISVPLVLVAATLLRSSKSSNFYVIFLHSLQDLVATISVLLISLLSIYSNLYYMDSVGNFLVLGIILYGNRKLLGRSVTVLMEGTSSDVESIAESLEQEFPGVHHLHIWDICEHQRMATLHMNVAPKMQLAETNLIKSSIEKRLSEYGITHVTIQFEPSYRSSNGMTRFDELCQ